MVEYEQGDTVTVLMEFRDLPTTSNPTGSLVDPSAATMTIVDSAGTTIATVTLASFTKESGSGKYHYHHDLSNTCELGTCLVTVTATIAGKERVLKDTFGVRKIQPRDTT